MTDKRDGSGGARRAWPLLVGLPIVILVAAAVVFFQGGGQEASRSAGQGVPSPADRPPAEPAGGEERASAGLGHPSRGSEDAPVTMIEYSDFQCPFCGKFAREVEPKLVEKYVESGTLRMEWRDFPYLGQESVNAALAARAAQAQGKFWEYHGLLYESQASANSGGFSDERLKELAREAGLDVEKFERDLRSGRYEQAVADDFREGQQRGISGTPTFFINGEILVGAQPLEVFERAIERAEREAEGG